MAIERKPLPKDKTEKITLLAALYAASKRETDAEIYAEILAAYTGTSVRALKGYKKQYGWQRGVHPAGKGKTAGGGANRIPVKPPAKPGGPARRKPATTQSAQPAYASNYQLPDILPRTQYSEDEKLRLVSQITRLFRDGSQTITEACARFGISYKTFHGWVNSNRVLYDLYQGVLTEQLAEQAALLERAATEALLERLQRREQKETVVQYRYRQQVNEVTGQFELVPVLESRKERTREVLPDAATIQETLRIVHDMKLLLKAEEPVPEAEAGLTDAELDEKISAAEAEIRAYQAENGL